MKYTTTGFELKASRFGGDFYYLFFKRQDGKSFRTCLDPKMRNFKRWEPVLKLVKEGKEVILYSLNEKKNDMIDADSFFKIEEQNVQRTI